ncbi:MAG: TetR/AcrR family transcriptional regulator [Gammaproteobacteria bacterium]|nr:helix-turn-helix domain containing protein [Gammaproteobacteria bacterium]MXY54855.1 TetR/AcrR family transcriptional regulator [Gammaproteobacteria bacterium]MYF27687.1 TetR/AcrR family transcriptional regulator [Gammaproteobacteria bacterium]MYK45089.1 TetR/AcrR family transcriptional regulator [Gammaproteobacteria bacterium]
MLASLREKKKRRTRADILAAAADFIERKGYRNANMRDIAAAADVAYQTLYNYFPSKARIAIALLARDDETDDRATGADADFVEALRALAGWVAQRAGHAERELALEALAEAIRGGMSAVRCLDPGIGEYLRDLLASAQQRGYLDAYVDTHEMAAAIESILNSSVLDRVMADEPDQAIESASVARIELVLKPYLRIAP